MRRLELWDLFRRVAVGLVLAAVPVLTACPAPDCRSGAEVCPDGLVCQRYGRDNSRCVLADRACSRGSVFRCVGVTVEQCRRGEWVVAHCCSDGTVCWVPPGMDPPLFYDCRPPSIVVGAGEACAPPGIECVTGFGCAQNGTCLQPCEPEAQTCSVEGDYCDDSGFLFGFCTGKSDEGVTCNAGASPAACAAAANACVPNGVGVWFECREVCAADDVGGGGGCSSGRACLAGTDTRSWADNWDFDVANTCPDPITDCSVIGPDYRCVTIRPISGGRQEICARPAGRCGSPVEILVAPSAAMLQPGALPPDLQCNSPGALRYCEPLDAISVCSAADGGDPQNCSTATAYVGCSPLDWFYSLEAGDPPTPIACTDFDLCRQAGGVCNPTGMCGYSAAVCVAFCDDPAGNVLICPTGLRCEGNADFGLVLQSEGGAEVPCSSTNDCNATAGFECRMVGSWQRCARNRRICME